MLSDWNSETRKENFQQTFDLNSFCTNVFLSREYFRASSKQRWARPVAPAATGGRVYGFGKTFSITPQRHSINLTYFIECSHRNFESLSFGQQNVFFRNSHILKRDSSSVASSLPHVNFLSTRCDAGPIAFNNEAGESLRSGCFGVFGGPGQDEVPVGDSTCRKRWENSRRWTMALKLTVSDPHFLSIQNPFVSFFDCARFQPVHIASSRRFSDSVCGHQRFLQQPSQVLFLLLGVSTENDWRLAETCCFKCRLNS